MRRAELLSRHTIGILLGYGCLLVWLSWPLAGVARSALPCPTAACTFDTLYSAWVLAYESHALGSAPLSFAQANIYHPTSDALFYGPAGLGTLPWFAPLYMVTGNPVLATNLTLLLCLALTAAALHLVVYRWTGSDGAGFVAALTLLTNRWLLFGFVGSTPHLAALQFFPLLLYLGATGLERPRRLLAMFVLLVLQCATDPVYVALAALAPLGVLAASRIVRPGRRASGVRLALVLGAAVVALVPVYAGYVRVRAANPDLSSQTLWPGTELRFDLSGLLWRAGPPVGPPTTIGPVAALLILAGLLAWWRRRRSPEAAPALAWQHAALWAVVGTLVSFTPTLLLFGHAFRLPRAYLALAAPFFRVARAPTRLGVAALMGLAVLSGLAFAALARLVAERAPRRGAQALLVVVSALLVAVPPVGARRLPSVYPTRPAPTVPVALRAALAARTGPLVRLPALGDRRRPSATANADAMLTSTADWRPLLNGYSSYWPKGFIERMRLAESLPNARALARLVRETGLASVWVDLDALSPGQRVAWQRSVKEFRHLGLVPVARDRGNLLLDVRPEMFR